MIAARTYGPGNKEGLPADWLAETKEVKTAEDAPDGWLVFEDQAEVDAYLVARKDAYVQAVEARPKDPTPLTIEERLTALEARVEALEK